MRVLVCIGLLVAALVAVEGAAAQAEPATADVEVTVWRRVSNPSLLYLSTRPEGGRWHTENTALDMSALSSTGRFHQSNAILVTVPLAGGGTATVEVTVWRRVSNPSLLYLSTRPEGGRWHTENTALEMSSLSSSGRFHQSNAVLVTVPLPDAPDTPATCVFSEQIERVASATFQVRTTSGTGTAFYIGNGEWITNHHVVDTASTVSLVHGQTRLSAQVAGSLPDYDLALLSARPSTAIPSLEFASQRPDLASPATAVGFPSGVVDTPSVTRGIVSKHAPFSQFAGFARDGLMIQIDAEINPGNSGGPIVNDCGAVVGVAVLKQDSTASGRDVDGIGFGIAAETVLAQLASLRSAAHRPGDSPQDEEESNLTIVAFCTVLPSEDLSSAECHSRSEELFLGEEQWSVWARGVVNWDGLVYRFNEGQQLREADVREALRALGTGCHELEIAETGISTHWSPLYEFCLLGNSPSIAAFCTHLSTEEIDSEECDRRSSNLNVGWERWQVWHLAVSNFDDVIYRFNREGEGIPKADVPRTLRALGRGCHNIQIAESGISTHWSAPYKFCFVDSPAPAASVPATPKGLTVAKVDVPLDFDDVMVSWNSVSGAAWYEVYHRTPGTQFDFEATVATTYYLDEWPNVLDPDSYIVRACNAAGCSEFSTVATQY